MALAFCSRNRAEPGAEISIASPGLAVGDEMTIEFLDRRRASARVIQAHQGRLELAVDGLRLHLRTPFDDGDEREGYAPAATAWHVERVEAENS